MSDLAYSIVIPSHKRPDLLRRTLDSVSKQNFPQGFDRVVVVENGGKFGAEEAAQAFSSSLNIEYMYEEIGNKSAALNAALARLSDQFVIFFDDDVRLELSVIEAYVDAAGQYPNSFFGGPVACDYETEIQPWLELPHSVLGWSLGDHQHRIDEASFLGANWAAFAGHIREVDGFDSRFGPGSQSGARGQEATMQQKLLGSGKHGIYLPKAAIWHYVPADRCSVDWSLDRAYQHSVTAGVLQKFDPSRRALGYPRWMIRVAVRLWRRAFIAKWVCSEQESYKRWLDYNTFRGKMEGQRQQNLRREVSSGSPEGQCGEAE